MNCTVLTGSTSKHHTVSTIHVYAIVDVLQVAAYTVRIHIHVAIIRLQLLISCTAVRVQCTQYYYTSIRIVLLCTRWIVDRESVSRIDSLRRLQANSVSPNPPTCVECATTHHAADLRINLSFVIVTSLGSRKPTKGGGGGLKNSQQASLLTQQASLLRALCRSLSWTGAECRTRLCGWWRFWSVASVCLRTVGPSAATARRKDSARAKQLDVPGCSSSWATL